tara:strand:+ start:334 stop:750 length:417 start_codon:yes stop_codon:yes gene_type:complete
VDYEFLFKVNFFSTSVMVGVIWVVQIIHYPSFHFINEKKYVEFQHFHMQRISFIVIPPMLIELASALLFAYFYRSSLTIILLALVLGIWVITFIFFTNMHQKLTNGYDRSIVDNLVQMNWSRTALWSLRLIILSSIKI